MTKRIMKRIAAVLLAGCIFALGAQAESGTFVFSVPEVLVTQAPTIAVQEAISEQPIAVDPSQIRSVEDLPWNLTLVNSTHAVPDDWTIPGMTELRRGQRVDSRIYPELQAMFDAARAAGIRPLVLTSYRTYEDQKQMLINKYRKFKDKGMSQEEAQAEALKLAAYPGYSEHQLGLAVDIDSDNTEECSNSEVWDWMKHHCQEYGFIWRYPGVKSEITGISNEEWHFRYVGVEAATYIMEHQICLEEYLAEVYGLDCM